MERCKPELMLSKLAYSIALLARAENGSAGEKKVEVTSLGAKRWLSSTSKRI